MNRTRGRRQQSWTPETWKSGAESQSSDEGVMILALRTVAALAIAVLLPMAAVLLPAAALAQTPALSAGDVVKAMTEADRVALQSDLVWAGHYNGAIDGEVGDRTIAAIKAFQKSVRGKETGVLNPQEREVLRGVARKLQQSVGWTVITDPATGIRLGLPLKRAPRKIADAGLTAWNSPQDTIQIRLVDRREPGATMATLAEREKRATPDRKVTYATVKPDFFVLSGTQGLKKFYVRGVLRGEQFRALTVLYDQATEGTMEPVVIAMSSAFVPFPAGARRAAGGRIRNRHRGRWRRCRSHHRRGGGGLHLDRGGEARQRRQGGRGQGCQSGAVAHLRRARPDRAAAWWRRQAGRGGSRRHCRSAIAKRGGGSEPPQGAGEP